MTLSSVEDDGLGEELQVIWELEPGACAYEKAELPVPTGFDDPRRLDAFLDAVKWGAALTADVRTLQSPFRSGIKIEDYQLDPVVRAIQMPRVSLLIADDVGLRKTIESGLVCQELISRHAARRVLIVCPSSLQIQWQEQMRDKFGLEFRIVDSGMMKLLRRTRGIHTNPWMHFPRLITSIDFLKRERPLSSFRELLPAEGEPRYPRRFDLLIVDEAHAKLREYTALRRKGAVDGTEKYATEFVIKLLKKRLFSSPAAFATTLEKHEDSVNSARRRGRHSTVPKPTEGLLRRQLTQQVEEDYADDSVYEAATTNALASAMRLFRELSGEKSRLLRELREWAGRSAIRPDSKAAELLRWLRAHIKPNGKWSDERVLIFTEYRATQKGHPERLPRRPGRYRVARRGRPLTLNS